MTKIVFFEQNKNSEFEKNIDQFNTIDEAIETHAALFSQHVAMQIWEEGHHKTMTYAALAKAMQQGAEHIAAAGIKPGDRVILLGKSRSIDWVIAFLSIIKAKATAAILDESLTANDIQKSITHCDVQAILTSQPFYDVMKENHEIPCLNIEDALQLFRGSIATPAKQADTQDNDPSIACLIFTSGTTSQQKAVLLSHKNLLHVATQSLLFSGIHEQDQVLGILPLNHSFGLCATIMVFLAGATITFVEKLTGEAILKAMQLSHTSLLIGTPRLLEAFYINILQGVRAKGKATQLLFSLLTHFCGFVRDRGWGNPGLTLFKSIHEKFGGQLTRIISGAAPLPGKIFRQLEELGWTVAEGYGLTETGGAISCNTLQVRRMGTVGILINNAKLKISNPNTSGEGEICFAGRNLMRGYFRDPVATDQVIRDGWLHTGDLGFLDKDGWLTITGRIKEIIVASSGKKIMPVDVEERYFGISGIQELAIVGIQSADQIHEEIHAAIIVDAKIIPSTLSPDETKKIIKDLLDARSHSIPNHLHIQHFHLVNELPKTSTFKVKRGELRKTLINSMRTESLQQKTTTEDSRTNNTSDNAITTKIIEIISLQCAPSIRITPESSLQFDLNLDSLGRIELADALKKEFRLELDDAFIFDVDKIKDIATLVTFSLSNRQKPETKGFTVTTLLKPRALLNTLFFAVFRSVAAVFWKLEFHGLQNLPDNTAFILCSNHSTNLDLLFVSSALKKKSRIRLASFAKQEIFEHWLLKHFAHFFNAIPVNRNGNITPALQTGIEALKMDWNLLIYPEGTRSRDGEIGAFKKGAAFISLQSGAPLIPVRIVGGFEIYPPSRALPRLINWKQFKRYRIQIYFGKPLESTTDVTEEILTDQLRAAVLQLSATE